jgi:hypothetical protein
MKIACIYCADTGWTCENHPRRPWEGPHACDCGGAGLPCVNCNLSDDDIAPQTPNGLTTGFDQKGWRH